MTTNTLSQLPLMAGSVVVTSLTKAGQWSFDRYMRAPLASTGVLAMVTLSAMAGSNALFMQTKEHPSPFFVQASQVNAVMPTPVVDRPEVEAVAYAPTELPVMAQPAQTQAYAPAPVTSSIPEEPVGNAQMFAVQKKLVELQLFAGKVDGYYGPQTAAAIRQFQSRNGMNPTGAADKAVVDAILNSDASGRVAGGSRAQAAPEQAITTPIRMPEPVQQVYYAPAPAPAPVLVPQPAPQPVMIPQPVEYVQPVAQQQAVLPPVAPPAPVVEAQPQVAYAATATIDNILANMTSPEAQPTTPTPSVAQMAQPVVQAQPEAAPTQVASLAPVAPTPAPAAEAAPEVEAARVLPANDTELVMQIQRGLASLGFFRAPIDGKPGPETAKAIREFENFHRYKMTGQVQPDLVDLLVNAGATI